MSPSAIDTIVNNSSLTSLENYFENSKSSYIENGVKTPKQLIGNALIERVQNIDHDTCEAGEEDTFFVADLGEVYRQHMRWKKNLPRVKPFYGEYNGTQIGMILTSTFQPSSVTRIPKLFAFWQNLVPGLIVPPRPKSNSS